MTHNRETFILSEGSSVCPCHPVRDGSSSLPCAAIIPAQWTWQEENESSQEAVPTFWINLSQGMPAALLCETSAVHRQHHRNSQQISTSKTPARLLWGTLHVIQRGNTSSKARVSGTILLGKKPKTQLWNKQFKQFKPFFSFSFLIAPGMSFSGVLF